MQQMVLLPRISVLVLLVVSLGACGPTADATRHGNLWLSVDAVHAEGDLGAPARASILITNVGSRDSTVEVSSTAGWIDPQVSAGIRLGPGRSSKFEVRLSCIAAGRVQHAWLLVESTSSAVVVPVRLTCGDEVDVVGGAFNAEQPLSLEPPLLRNAGLVRVDAHSGPFRINLDVETDFLVLMPEEPVRQAMAITGGRNVVMVGGEIEIPWQGEDPSRAERRALFARRMTGTFHLEGVLFHGDDISEGIQLSTPNAHVQITNVAVMDIRARDQVGFTDNHPDLIQSYGGAKSIVVDRFTGSSDYQGFLFQVSSPVEGHGPVTLKRVNLIGKPTARYLLWFSLPHDGETIYMNDVWIEVPSSRRGGIGRAVWPDVNGDYPRRAEVFQEAGHNAVRWSEELRPPINGYAIEGRPPHGDFVSTELVGVGYQSPGYVIGSE